MPEGERGELLKTYFLLLWRYWLGLLSIIFSFLQNKLFVDYFVCPESRKSSKLIALLENKIFDSNGSYD
jgi:hypothetical protein